MTRSTGEHELVLGNKQLLSAFFVVAILLGVFFTMGYFVGKNTASASGFSLGPSATPAVAQTDSSGKPVAGGAGGTATDGGGSSASSGQDQGAAPTPAPSSGDADASSRGPTASETAPADHAVVHPSAEQMYLQVFALRKPDADNEVKVLRDSGFPALIGESSKKGIFRVLVGPFKTQTELGHKKSELKAKGFDSIVAH